MIALVAAPNARRTTATEDPHREAPYDDSSK